MGGINEILITLVKLFKVTKQLFLNIHQKIICWANDYMNINSLTVIFGAEYKFTSDDPQNWVPCVLYENKEQTWGSLRDGLFLGASIVLSRFIICITF